MWLSLFGDLEFFAFCGARAQASDYVCTERLGLHPSNFDDTGRAIGRNQTMNAEKSQTDTARTMVKQTKLSTKRLHDPILEELWAVKAQINAEGGYDLQTILTRAKMFADPFFDATGHLHLPAKTIV
jgi:hypothetical protein